MNLLRCAFNVTFGKFLDCIIWHKGIEIDQIKIKVIWEMPPPNNLKKLQGLQERFTSIRWFISNLASRCHPFSHLMKKGAPFKWNDSREKIFHSIKKYLSSLSMLGTLVFGKPVLLYIAVQEHSLVALCAQENREDKERAFHYSS